MITPVIDTHVHLDEIPNPAQAVEEAREAGVLAIVAVGMDLSSNIKILDLARRYPGYVYPAIGYHPWKITLSGVRENLRFLEDHLDEASALGEIGLDYKIEVERELQHLVFQDLLDLAWRKNKPAIIHARQAHEDAFEMVRRNSLRKAVFHWYSGPLEVLKRLLREGYAISATPALAYSPKHQEALAVTPLKQVLLETDAPVRYQGVDSRPAFVAQTLAEVARIKGLDPEEVASRTNQNARDFFRIV
jgi:TatD DNase family protein